MLALRETFRVFTINAFFIFERPFVAAGACAYMGFGWHMDAGMRGYIIYTYIEKIKKWFYTGDSVPRYPPTGDSVPRYPPTGDSVPR
jgi:hypothetical protein